jgi:UDP-N-acetyl-D-mannosaminuronic acid dehydrogenase
VSVLGLGRVGLPLAVILARSGLNVLGVDIDEDRILLLKKGELPFHYPEIHEWLKEVMLSGSLTFVASPSNHISKSDVVIVTVGTPTGLQYQLDYSQLHSAFRELATPHIKDKAIIVRSTSAPGTLANIILPMLTDKSDLQCGRDFALAACPERILEGQAHRELYELPEIVGAFDSLSAQIATEIFKKINANKVILVTTPTAAELAKLFTNVYRYVNFAIANEFAVWAEKYGEDAHEVIRMANEEYARPKIPKPGFTGGPCLSKDGFLLDNGTTFSSIVSTAWKINENVTKQIVGSLLDELGSLYGKKIAVLGLSFKRDSDDVRLSPSAKLVDILRAYGANTAVHDPHVAGTMSLQDALDGAMVVILATNHSCFKDSADAIDRSGCRIVYDVWGTYSPLSFKSAKYLRFGGTKSRVVM